MPDDPGENQHADPAGTASVGDVGDELIGGRYRVLDRLGSGAMADVYRAHDETLDRDVAVKVFRAGMEDGDTAGTARRELELQALAQLSHPNLITLFDGNVSDEHGPAFLALELVEGPTLAGMLREGALPEPQVRQIGAQIAEALAYVHERGMVHRDVKPANILLGRDGSSDLAATRARLSDFGIVRLIDSAQVTAADLTVGTAYYLAPEQARSAAVGPEADVYSLGLVLLEALTGARPFEGPMHEVLVARLSRDPDIPANLAEPWPGLLTAMTASDPAQRPSAADVARTLRAVPGSGAFPIVGAAGIGAAAAPAAAAALAAGPASGGTEASTASGRTAALGAAAGAAAGAAGAAGVAGAAGTAGTAGAAGSGPIAAAQAPTTAVPRTGMPPTTPPASFPPGGGRHASSPADPAEDVEPARHHLTGILIAAAIFLAIIGGAGWFFLRPSGHSTPPPTQGQPGTSVAPNSGGPTSASGSRRGSGSAGAPVPVDQTLSGGPGGTARSHHAHSGGSGGASSSQPAPRTSSRSSSQPPTSAPPTHPTTTARPTTSAPPSTSKPPTTSAPPSSASSTPTSAASSPAAPPPTVHSSSSAPVDPAGSSSSATGAN